MQSRSEMSPIRKQALHGNASPRRAERIIEAEYNLPEGSVKLLGPRGGTAKHRTINKLREAWDKRLCRC